MSPLNSDHLGGMFGTSRGSYVPGAFDLRLHGLAGLTDRLVHHHEAQHALLTATTAWGTALLVSAQTPGWRPLFEQLLERCRITHESFATFLSRSVLTTAFGGSIDEMASFPEYVHLVDRLNGYLGAVGGEQRRGLAVTALARACMQTPIVTVLLAAWPDAIKVSALRAIDLPDDRWNYLLRRPAGLPAEVVAAADAAVIAEHGPLPLAEDRPGGNALADRFDRAWARWEDTVFRWLARQLTSGGATVVAGNDHIPAATELVRLAQSRSTGPRLRVHPDPEVPDTFVLDAVLRQGRHWLATLRHPARMIVLDEDVELAEVVRVADATTRVAGRPNLVIQVRLAARLLAGFDLPDEDRARLGRASGPIAALRTIADDGHDQGTDVVWLVRLPRSADVTRLAAAWGDRGSLTCCVGASCLADGAWRQEWLPTLRDAAAIVWLIDVPISMLAGELSRDGVVWGIYLDLELTPAGPVHAVAFKAPSVAGVWLAVADRVGVEMLTQQVAELDGIDLQMTGTDWSDWLPSVRLVLLDLLRTESYVDFRPWSD